MINSKNDNFHIQVFHQNILIKNMTTLIFKTITGIFIPYQQGLKPKDHNPSTRNTLSLLQMLTKWKILLVPMPLLKLFHLGSTSCTKRDLDIQDSPGLVISTDEILQGHLSFHRHCIQSPRNYKSKRFF